MKLNKVRVSFIAGAMALVMSVATVAASISDINITKNAIDEGKTYPKTLALVNADFYGISASDTDYAHNVIVNSDGEFVFSANGKNYDSEYERILGEDGFLYGVNWDWFGSWQQNITNLGNSNINGQVSYYNAAQVERALYNLKALGFNCWSNWIGPYGTYTYDEKGLVTGLEPTFVTNLTALLDSCRKVGIDFVPGLLTHNWGNLYNSSALVDGLTPQEIVHKYFRFYYEEEARNAYINNGVNKVCEILAQYQDVIPIVALTIENGSTTNDVNTGMLYKGSFGFTWEDFAILNNAMHDAVKRYLPNTPTSVEDVGGWKGNIYKYNDLKVDIEGFNYYTTSNFPDISSMMLNKPAYLGEFDVYHDSADYDNASNEYLDNIRSSYYEKAVKGGYLGAFYYPFFYNDASPKNTFFTGSSTDRYDEIRGFVINMAYNISDLKNEYKGVTEMDRPSLLYNNGSNVNYWLGARNTDHYILERSDNGGEFKVIADNIIPTEHMLNNGLISYTDESLVKNVNYRYRVTAVDSDGKKSVSLVGNVFDLFIPEESFVDSKGNYAGGFEQGTLNGVKANYPSDGWYKEETWMNDVGQFKTGDSRTGDYSFVVDVANGIGGGESSYDRRWAYNLQLKPNTQYTLTMWSKNSNCMYGVTIIDGETKAQLKWTYPANYSLETKDQWLERVATFTTGSSGKIRVRLSNTMQSDALVNLDDISIKEAR